MIQTSWLWQLTPNETSLLLTGDLNIQQRKNPTAAFKYVLATLRDADVLFGQLEMPLSPPSSDPMNPDIPHKARWRHSDPSMVKALQDAQFDAVACASNVSYPPQAGLNSNATLDAAGIREHCGTGRNIAEARKPAVVEKNGVRFGLLSYTSVFWPVNHAATETTPGCATIKIHTGYEPDRRALEMPGALPIVLTVPDRAQFAAMLDDVRQLRKEVDIVVVSCHWGISSSQTVVSYQRDLARAAVEAGADVVFGHHPHKIQEIEVYQGKPIFYSLGNFAFDWEKMRGRNLEGLLVRASVQDKKLAAVSIVPVKRNEENLIKIHAPTETEGKAVTDDLLALCKPLDTWLNVLENEISVGGIG